MKIFWLWAYFIFWPQGTFLELLFPGKITSFEYTAREQRILWIMIPLGVVAQILAVATWYYELSWWLYGLSTVAYIILAFINIFSVEGDKESESEKWQREVYGDHSSDQWSTRRVDPN